MKQIKDVPDALDGVQLIGLQILEQRRWVRALSSSVFKESTNGQLTPVHNQINSSFYPLFPVPLKEASNVNLDITHAHLLHLDVAPDIMIIPSRLRSGHRVSPQLLS